jgi:hypothetical protein
MSNILFLGGTVGKNNWREGFIQRVTEAGVPVESLFNPVTPNWDEEFQKLEDGIKGNSDNTLLFYIGDTQDGTGLSFYSNTEAILALFEQPERTIVAYDLEGLEGHALKAMKKTAADLSARFPGLVFSTLAECEAEVIARFGGAAETATA